MGSLGVKIKSNFTDYYDYLSKDNNYVGIYNRVRPYESRVKLLNELREYGYNVIDIKSVREFDNSFNEVVIYTDPYLHNYSGKRVVSIEEARLSYINYLAARYYKESNGITIKLLHIGSRRFRLILKSENPRSLKEGKVVEVKELESGYNYRFMCPIYSIDYIPTNYEMVVIDFNKVQKLSHLKFNYIMKPEEVVLEIKKALLAYNL